MTSFRADFYSHNNCASHCNLDGLAGGHSWSGSKKTIRKLLRWTSTHDVGRLAEVIGNLPRMTESHLGHSIEGVVVASPNFPALCNKDVEEAIRHAGLNPLSPYGHPYQPHEIATAYARHGFGLCKNNGSIEACNTEENRLPFQQTLAVSHTSTAFIATIKTIETAFIPRDLLEGQHVAELRARLAFASQTRLERILGPCTAPHRGTHRQRLCPKAHPQTVVTGRKWAGSESLESVESCDILVSGQHA